MALPTSRLRTVHVYAKKGPGTLKAVGRVFSHTTSWHEPGTEGSAGEASPKRFTNPLLHVQTHTGVRNMAHGLHILRRIEEKFGVIESYLFPRESGTNEYHPTFFFRFRDSKAIRGLSKPFTHFDVPILTLEDKPNHTIGINDVGYLISPDSPDFSLVHSLELMTKRAQESVDADAISEENATSGSPSKPSTLKSRYAVRIAVSGLNEYPQPFFSHKIINPREKPRIQRELASWKSAYEVFGSSVAPPSQSEILPQTQTIEKLLQQNFNVPQDTLVLPKKKYTRQPELRGGNGSGEVEQPPRPTEYQLFKVHSRRAIRPASGDSPPGSTVSAEDMAENSLPAEGIMADGTPNATPPLHSTPQFSAKRERQLEQMRRAAASQVRSVAEKRRIEEEAAKQAKLESEVDHHVPSVKQGLSLWDKFLKR